MQEKKKPVVAAFDFDGTITRKDTFIDFAKFALPSSQFLLGIMLFSPLLALIVLKLISGGPVKEKLFSFWFRGWTRERYHEAADAYCKSRFDSLVRKKALEAIDKHLRDGDMVLLVSACTEEVLKPFAKRFGIKEENVLGTRTEFQDGRLTGAFAGENCKGKEKVRRILEAKPQRDSYYLVAYGDSAGDKEMLSFADRGFYREFQ